MYKLLNFKLYHNIFEKCRTYGSFIVHFLSKRWANFRSLSPFIFLLNSIYQKVCDFERSWVPKDILHIVTDII